MPEATVTVLLADLETMMAFLAAGKWNRVDDPGIATAWKRLTEAKEVAMGLAEPAEPPLPPGDYGRIELPGYREHVGWVSDGMRAGMGVLVVRRRDGQVIAEVVPGPNSRFVHLPVPVASAVAEAELAALPAGAHEGTYCDDDEPPDRFMASPEPF